VSFSFKTGTHNALHDGTLAVTGVQRMNLSRCLFVCALALAPALARAAPELGWMQGSWCGATGAVREEEVWLAPRGNLLLGMHRDTQGETARGFEFLRIELRADSATYVAQPGGRPPVRFELAHSGTQSETFENLAHDYPKRIHYERPNASTLVAWIEGAKDGEKRRTWTWSPCPANQ
jgi:hypothetical protein